MYSKDTGKDQMLMTMERALTSGQKAGFFFLGFLGGIVGILAASLMNINAPYRPEGTKMAALDEDGLRSRHPYRTCWLHRATRCQIEVARY